VRRHPRFREQVILGAGSLSSFVGYTGIAAFAVPVYQIVLGVNPALLGAALALPRVWEALADPLMGAVSDNFRSRWGRRRPLIVLGACAMGVAYGLTWMVPPGWSSAAKLAYFTAMSTAYFTAYTVFSVSYAGLTFGFAPDYEARTSVMAYCGFFNKVGEFCYQWMFPLSQLALFGGTMAGVRVVGWAVGLGVLLGTGALPGLFVRERFANVAARQGRVSLLAGTRAALRQPAFLIVAGLAFVNAGMGMLTSTLDQYVLIYYVCAGSVLRGTAWKAALSSAYALVGIAAIPVVVRLADRFGKARALAGFYLLTIAGGLLKAVLFARGHPALALLDPLCSGPVWIAANVLLPSMLADICDEDELDSGQRREGIYAAVFAWIQKMAVSGSVFLAGLALLATGFDQQLGPAQTAGTLHALRGLLVAATALPPFAALWLLRRYRLNAEAARVTRAALETRRRGLPATSPA
jgi:GPH family glycoside/pentoside/hexuronide:cation symporter